MAIITIVGDYSDGGRCEDERRELDDSGFAKP